MARVAHVARRLGHRAAPGDADEIRSAGVSTRATRAGFAKLGGLGANTAAEEPRRTFAAAFAALAGSTGRCARAPHAREPSGTLPRSTAGTSLGRRHADARTARANHALALSTSEAGGARLPRGPLADEGRVAQLEVEVHHITFGGAQAVEAARRGVRVEDGLAAVEQAQEGGPQLSPSGRMAQDLAKSRGADLRLTPKEPSAALLQESVEIGCRRQVRTGHGRVRRGLARVERGVAGCHCAVGRNRAVNGGGTAATRAQNHAERSGDEADGARGTCDREHAQRLGGSRGGWDS